MSTAQPAVIAGGEIVDGTGAPRRRADLLLTRGRIERIGTPGEFDAFAGLRRVDASGQVIAPGFVDVHSHSDNSPLLGFDDTAKILQGVTTEVNGNCGFGLAPVAPHFSDEFASLIRRIFPAFDVDWRTPDELRAVLDGRGYVTNFATLIGHNSLRVAAMGIEERPPSKQEMGYMRAGVEEALAAGAAGLSTGLIYPPGVFSRREELIELVSGLPEQAVYASHMRNEGLRLAESIDETVDVAVSAGVRCHISHLKAAHSAAWGTMPEVIAGLDARRLAGTRLTHDVYPYTAWSTMLSAVLPPWMHDGGSGALLERLRSPEQRARADADMAEKLADWDSMVDASGWERIVIASTASHRYEGSSVAHLSGLLGKPPVDVVADLLIDEDLAVTMICHGMSEDDVRAALASPHTTIGSDGLPVGTGGKPHPRGYGTFVRVLDEYVRRRGVLSLEEAVRKMTSLPAEIFSIPDRGIIAPGRIADLVVFDPDGIRDETSYENPTEAPVGIDSVWLAGEAVVRAGEWLGVRRGRFLPAAL